MRLVLTPTQRPSTGATALHDITLPDPGGTIDLGRDRRTRITAPRV